jgi:tRNA(adenine34) deaminase
MDPEEDLLFMREAIGEAERALAEGEIPVGAVIVRSGRIVGRGRNGRRRGDPLAHAEIEALRDAADRTGAWRFDGCAIYVTLEPCAMCAGALVQCRLSRLVFGAADPRAGAAGSLYDIPGDPRSFHRCTVRAGVEGLRCAALLREYFLSARRGRDERGNSGGP